ncbi:MAG: DNA ligase [Hyphomicrobiales bacterium]|nr:RNA ligase family protein [Hyphomicrobiales bacterium]PCJ88209.1 MAG: DNA ligase [Hyphomicrobiales bacterium]
MNIIKYPRTWHVEGSRLQLGDLSDDKPIVELRGQFLIIEEKVDGANSGISFQSDGTPKLQSRGHFLVGGYRERHFDLLKTWVSVHAPRLFEALGTRYIMYGEWMYAKHTVFYDQLAHYFLEFDVYDCAVHRFLSSIARRDLLKGLPVMPAPIVYQGIIATKFDIKALVKPSIYKSENWRSSLAIAAEKSGSRSDFVEKQTENSNMAEGVYLKLEDGAIVTDRFKYVRGDFLQAIEASDGHWQDRPILPNGLAAGVDIFAPVLGVKGAYDERL